MKAVRRWLGERVRFGSVRFSGYEYLMMIDLMARWLSWLERRPVTAEVVGSSPIRVVCTEDLKFCAIFFVSIIS